MAPTRHIKLGILVPSSNTAMEPEVNRILNHINSLQRQGQKENVYITAHFSRFRVTQISLDSTAKSQFDVETMIQAASLLADAGVDAIAWGGTSAGWLGIDSDRHLCRTIKERFQIPATTSTLALLKLMSRVSRDTGSDSTKAIEIGLVTPYIPAMNEAIKKNFAAERITVVEHCGLSITKNQEIARVSMDTLDRMVGEILALRPDLGTIVVFCTNIAAAAQGVQWELRYAEQRLIVLDSVAATVWGLLSEVNADVTGLGLEKVGGKMFTTA